MADTTYDIKVNYMLDDKASKGIAAIAAQAKRGADKVDLLSKGMGLLAAGAGVFGGLRLGKKLFIDYTDQIERASVKMSGLLQMNMGGAWARNQQRANFLVARFAEDSKKSAGTTKDFVDMGSMLVQPLSAAGASIEDIASITRGAVIASQAFGIEAEVAARDIGGALRGQLKSTDLFARSLLEPLGFTSEKWNEMVKKDGATAATELLKAFNQPAIKNMAEEQGKSWAGITSTLQDNLERAFAKVGLPLMKKLGEEMSKLNDWFDRNPKKVEEITKNIADAFVKAFNMAKSIFGFIIEHKGLLMMIAKAVLVSKGISALGTGITNIGSLLASFSGGLGGGGVGGAVTGFATKLGNASIALGALAIAAQGIADWVDAKQTKRIENRAKSSGLKERARVLGGAMIGAGTGISGNHASDARAIQLGYRSDRNAYGPGVSRRNADGSFALGAGVAQAGARQQALAEGRYTANDKMMAGGILKDAVGDKILGKNRKVVNPNQLADMFGARDGHTKGYAWANNPNLRGHKGQWTPGELAKEIEKMNRLSNDEELRNMSEFLRGLERAILMNPEQRIYGPPSSLAGPLDNVGADKSTNNKPKSTNVHISKIEVVSDDPDRFAFSLVGAFQDFNKSPTQAKNAINGR